ncbi:site-specific integrase [Porphyromonas pogonae]|uniref:site-specific integrase n=1 Tax=Porphyromonas pogonae TaxID=867595 RepID=UPI002E792644|nr:site-specific integrase [Porphyromonas pogonae]
MRSTFTILFYINRNKIKTDGTTAVLCRITVDGKQTALTTGIYCNPEDWNAKKGEVKEEKSNHQLAAFRNRIEQAYETILKEQGIISAELLKNTLVGVNSVPTMLLQAGEAELEQLRLRSLETASTSTYRQSKLTQQNLKAFVCSREKKDIAFEAITEEFGESFKLFCKRELGFSLSHTNRHLCWLNRLIYIAVDQEVLRANPLEEVEYEKKDPPKLHHITRSQLKQIMESPMPNEAQELARRAFIFSSFCGLAYVDLQGLYPRHIGKTSEGRLYIRKKRVKTNVEAFIPLHPVARQILKLYNTTDDSTPIFPLPKNRDVNWFQISSVGIALGFKENLSHHMSRHSFGTLLLSAGISIESIAKMMGHANISTTQGYAKVTDDKISEDMDRLMKRRKLKQNNAVQTERS